MKKFLWALVISLPVLSTIWTLDTVRSIGVGYELIAPRYPEVTEASLTQLDSKALVKLAANVMNRDKALSEWWRVARESYDLLTYALLGFVFLLAAAMADLLRRMPSNPPLNDGRAKSGAHDS
jgi:hypothetical protein